MRLTRETSLENLGREIINVKVYTPFLGDFVSFFFFFCKFFHRDIFRSAFVLHPADEICMEICISDVLIPRTRYVLSYLRSHAGTYTIPRLLHEHIENGAILFLASQRSSQTFEGCFKNRLRTVRLRKSYISTNEVNVRCRVARI